MAFPVPPQPPPRPNVSSRLPAFEFPLEIPLHGRLNGEQVDAVGLVCHVHLQIREPPYPTALLGNCMDSSSAARARYWNDQIRFSSAAAHLHFPRNEPCWFDRFSDPLTNLKVRRGLCYCLLIDITMAEGRCNNRHQEDDRWSEEHKKSEAAEGNLPQRIALQPTLFDGLGVERIRRRHHGAARGYLGLSRCT